MDAKDILGLPKTPSKQEKKLQPKKESHRKPDGISREVYALTGGLGSLTTSIDANKLKKQQQSDEKITWEWLPFTNSARKDNLQLYHWVKVVNGVPPTGDYLFAKYNKSVDVVKYTDEEYDKYLTDPKWTKEETDQLFDLCQRFDLRFVVIADRFPTSRTVEELKDRFYSVSRAILVARAASPKDVSGHPLIKEPYNVSQDIERKRALSIVLSRKKQQEQKETEVLEEAKRIIQTLIAAGKMVQKLQVKLRESRKSKVLTRRYKNLEVPTKAERGNIGSPESSETAKKRPMCDQDHPFVPDSSSFGGERPGRKDQKRKGRY